MSGARKKDGGDGTTSSPNTGLAKYSEAKIRAAIAKMIIVDELPFRFVEGQGFKDFMVTVEPRFPIPSRITVMRDCMKLYLTEQRKLRSMFKTSGYRVCLTTDLWISVQNLNYMCLTAHFIDNDWNLRKRIINFVKIPNHKGLTIGREIESCLLHWGIDNIFTITVDNASANDVVIDYLKRRTKEKESVILDNEFMHIRCCAHILNLIVNDGLKEINDSVTKVRNTVKYVKSSPARLDKFRSCAERNKICGGGLFCLDVPTRWNSTYLMLSSALKHQRAFDLLQEEDDQFVIHLSEDGQGRPSLGPPTFNDWEIVGIFVRFLKIFYDVTLRISGSSYATSNFFIKEVFAIFVHLNKYCRSVDYTLSSMAEKMILKYNKYWGDFKKVDKILFVAAILDLRSKIEVLKFWFIEILGTERAAELVAMLRGLIDRLYKQYSISSDSGGLSRGASNIDETQSTTTSIDDEDDFYSRYHLYQASKGVRESKSELDQYFIGGVERGNPKFDILMWWKVNSTKFPILAKIARDVLAILISTVASESAFSVGGRVLDPFRSLLAPTTVEALVCAQNWLKAPSIDYDSQDLMDDAESYKLEAEISLKNILNEED